jgi:hypothetical protein
MGGRGGCVPEPVGFFGEEKKSYINPNTIDVLQRLFYLTTALHVSGVTITHLQEHKTTVTTATGNRHTVLLSAAIMEELELI